MSRLSVSVAAALVLLCSSPSASGQHNGYVVTDLGTFGGDTYAWDINDQGLVSGRSQDASGNWVPFTWTSAAGLSPMSLPSGAIHGSPTFLSETGHTCGYSGDGVHGGLPAASMITATMWLSAPSVGLPAGVHELGNLGGPVSVARRMNANVEVVGRALTASGETHGFLWLPQSAYGMAAGMHDLGTLGGADSHANDVDNAGRIVGFSATTPGSAFSIAFIWDSTTGMQALQPSTLGGNYSSAQVITDSGVIAGAAYLPTDFQQHACLWLPALGGYNLVDLGVLPGLDTAECRDAIDTPSGPVVVGGCNDFAGTIYVAFVYSSGIGLVDLNSLLPSGSGWVLEVASGVNAQGQIVGWGQLNGQLRGFLLTPSLQLSATPNPVAPSQTLTVTASGGVPGYPFVMGITEVNGFPIFPYVVTPVNTVLDLQGMWSTSAFIPQGFSGLNWTLLSATVDPTQSFLAVSNAVVLSFQ